ncbi:hypothetical protein HYT23_06030 [Candidatus Pacearchaeota archaeon]|nr:hypothetical protein [Candidatus Pacearchaeota archaeon]
MEKQGTASQLSLPNGVIYIGVDESNHGHSPEIVVGAMSGLEEKIVRGRYKKQRKIPFPLDSLLNEVDYSFLVINKRDQCRVSEPNFLGFQVSSLLQDLKNPNIRLLSIFLDGIPAEIGRPYVRDMVSEVCSIPRGNIAFNFGARFDEAYSLVNIADGIAYNLAFCSNRETLENHPHRKYLING